MSSGRITSAADLFANQGFNANFNHINRQQIKILIYVLEPFLSLRACFKLLKPSPL
jgi:hypothetical protein